MKVVENDRVISGMLHDERNRCQEMLDGLKKSVAGLPKGVIKERRKRYKDKVYFYYYLKYRDSTKVVNKHISNEEVQDVLKKLELRKKYEKEIRSYKKRIDYLNKIINAGKTRGHPNRSQE